MSGDNPSADLLVLTGPPGAGKSTIARMLADSFERSVHLHADDFWHFIRGGKLEPWLPEAHHQNQVVIDVLSQAAASFAQGGYQVVIDGILGPWFLDRFLSAISTRQLKLAYVILRPREDVTLGRAQARAVPALTEERPLRHMYRAFTALGRFEAHVLDTSGQEPVETFELVRRCFHDPRFLVPGAQDPM